MQRVPRPGGWRRLALLGVALATAGTAHSRMELASLASSTDRVLPRAEQARLSSLGFDALLSDVYWLEAVQLVGSTTRSIDGFSRRVAHLIDLVTTLDPWVGHPYRFAAVWLDDSVESVGRANRLLERGIAYHPDDWRNRHYLGFNQFFHLADRRAAADSIESALELPGAPIFLGGLVAKLRLEGDGLETAAVFLEELARSTADEYARAEHLKALDEIETERRARFLDAARAAYRERFARDIERVGDLTRGPRAVLRRLPRAHPHFDGFHWELDRESRQIVSSFYGSRYQLYVHPLDRGRVPTERPPDAGAL